MSAFERHDFGVVVVRRCVDLADLLAAASAGTARAVILSADLRRLDRDALARLATAGVAVIGLVPGRPPQRRRRTAAATARRQPCAGGRRRTRRRSPQRSLLRSPKASLPVARTATPWLRRPPCRAARRPCAGDLVSDDASSPSNRRTARRSVGSDRCAWPHHDRGCPRHRSGAAWLPDIASGRRLLRRRDRASSRAAR